MNKRKINSSKPGIENSQIPVPDKPPKTLAEIRAYIASLPASYRRRPGPLAALDTAGQLERIKRWTNELGERD